MPDVSEIFDIPDDASDKSEADPQIMAEIYGQIRGSGGSL